MDLSEARRSQHCTDRFSLLDAVVHAARISGSGLSRTVSFNPRGTTSKVSVNLGGVGTGAIGTDGGFAHNNFTKGVKVGDLKCGDLLRSRNRTWIGWEHNIYNDGPNAAGEHRTSTQKQSEVESMLRLLGTPKGAANRLAALYASSGKDGDALHHALETQTAGRTPRPTNPIPDETEMDAVAREAPDNTPERFRIYDTSNPDEFYLGAEIVNGNQVFFAMRTVSSLDPTIRSTLSGEYMFGKMMDHFEAHHASLEILGAWGYETNHALYNALKDVGMTRNEAASGTRTADWAYNRRYTDVKSVTENEMGTAVDVAIAKPPL